MGFFKKLKVFWKCRKEIILSLKIKVDFIAFQKNWREKNCHNGTTAANKFDSSKVIVGDSTYGRLRVLCWDNPKERLVIGNYYSIAEDVSFLLGGVHPLDRITTFPYISHVLGETVKEPTGSKGPIIVEDDVWICQGVTILSGVTIGKGSVIGAGSVVSKDIPKYSIVINGKVIKRRLPNEVIEKIENFDLHNIKQLTKENRNLLLTTELTVELFDRIINQQIFEDI
jgi:acetyltransferase-like isoleucine patch superfamily enzyme